MAEYDFKPNSSTRQINPNLNLGKSKSTDSIMNTINRN